MPKPKKSSSTKLHNIGTIKLSINNIKTNVEDLKDKVGAFEKMINHRAPDLFEKIEKTNMQSIKNAKTWFKKWTDEGTKLNDSLEKQLTSIKRTMPHIDAFQTDTEGNIKKWEEQLNVNKKELISAKSEQIKQSLENGLQDFKNDIKEIVNCNTELKILGDSLSIMIKTCDPLKVKLIEYTAEIETLKQHFTTQEEKTKQLALHNKVQKELTALPGALKKVSDRLENTFEQCQEAGLSLPESELNFIGDMSSYLEKIAEILQKFSPSAAPQIEATEIADFDPDGGDFKLAAEKRECPGINEQSLRPSWRSS